MSKTDIQIDVKYARNCIQNPVISLRDGFELKLTEKCVVLIDNCYDMKPYKKSALELTFFKGKSKLLQEKIDLCGKVKKQKEITQVLLTGFGLSFDCPIQNVTSSCSKERKVYDFNPIAMKLVKGMYGSNVDFKIRAAFVHDTGKSCVEVEIKLKMT